jgi:holo-ACP synthase CitX
MPVTLEQLLQSRDNRAKHQKDLLGEYPGRSLLCMTVQLPGPEKRNRTSLAIAKAGVQAIREAFEPTYEELKDLETGYEAYFLVDLPALETKKRACQIEDTHPLGRLMDIDVLTLPVSENYFSEGFPKNQFSETSTNPPSRPVSGNYFSQGFAKNQFPETSTRPARVDTVSRLDIGLEARRCLLCDNEVRYCMRAKLHTKEELLSRIEQMLKEYELQAPNPRTD